MSLVAAPPAYLNEKKHLEPDLVPNSLTDVYPGNCYIEEMTFSTAGATSATVTVQDKQGTPRVVVKDLAVDPGAPVVVRFDGRYCPGGVSWQASVAGAVVGYIRIR